jgi:hypothetical protein
MREVKVSPGKYWQCYLKLAFHPGVAIVFIVFVMAAILYI